MNVRPSTSLRCAQDERTGSDPDFDMAYLQLDPDTRLHYQLDTWADPWTAPESVVLIHGFTESTEAWRPWVPHLGRCFSVLRY